MLYDLQNKNVFSVRLKLGYCWFGGHLSGGRVFQALGAATLNRSRKRFPADGSRSTNYSGWTPILTKRAIRYSPTRSRRCHAMHRGCRMCWPRGVAE